MVRRGWLLPRGRRVSRRRRRPRLLLREGHAEAGWLLDSLKKNTFLYGMFYDDMIVV